MKLKLVTITIAIVGLFTLQLLQQFLKLASINV